MKKILFLTTLFIFNLLFARQDTSSVLVIVDVQTEFYASQKTIAHILKNIQNFKKKNKEILFVVFKNKGPVIPELLNEVEGYQYMDTVVKEKDDGSLEILKSFEERGISPNFIKVVGVNICCCVQSTVKGLSEKVACSTKIVVDPDGCHCHGHYEKSEGFIFNRYDYYKCVEKEEAYIKMEKLKNVKVLASQKRKSFGGAVIKKSEYDCNFIPSFSLSL